MVTIQSDVRSAILVASALRQHHRLLIPLAISFRVSLPPAAGFGIRVRAFSTNDSGKYCAVAGAGGDTVVQKPPICTADELHYVSVNNSDWRLALWRYNPPPHAPKRNHPLLLLSGVGTNAVGYDLAPGSSFARYMSGQGFETWILEVRGAGLSTHESDSKDIEKSAHAISDWMEAAVDDASDTASSAGQPSTNSHSDSEEEMDRTNGHVFSKETDSAIAKEVTAGIATAWDESQLVTKLSETFMSLSERLSGFLSEGQSKIMSAKLFDQISKFIEDSFLFERFSEVRDRLLSLLESRQNSAISGQIRDLSQKLVIIIEEGQRSVSPQLFDLQERLTTIIEDFQKQLDLIVKYDWDFDNYLEEDVPAAVRWNTYGP